MSGCDHPIMKACYSVIEPEFGKLTYHYVKMLWRDIETKFITQYKPVALPSQVTSATVLTPKNTAITNGSKSIFLFQNNFTITSKEKNEMKNENSTTSTSTTASSLPKNASQSAINYFNYNDCGSARRSVICEVCGEEGHDRSTCSYNSRKSTITW
ncbi:19944_t:CDS:2 [Dentiscutata erythropus]|uniref:19944_t:CDS:1 n=1 Tax=Dentiscutata erythropus TaxID=1348616 RepID=A0A9N9DRU3_9GLOM|nr:19944_t:CDS:2 [Dentiscutata erythropus]